MTDQTAVDRIPIARSVVYAVRGLPEIADEYNATRTIAPTQISLTYRAAEDSQLGRVHAYVSGWWMQDGQRVPMDKPVGRHFWGRTFADWPEWLAGEARLHDPDAATASAGQAPAAEAQQPSLAVEDCTCIPFTRQGGVQRYCQPGDTVDMISGWEIGGDCPHHRDAVKAQQPTQRNIQCPDAFWRPRRHAPHNWQQAPDTQTVHCRGVDEAQQPKEARS